MSINISMRGGGHVRISGISSFNNVDIDLTSDSDCDSDTDVDEPPPIKRKFISFVSVSVICHSLLFCDCFVDSFRGLCHLFGTYAQPRSRILRTRLLSRLYNDVEAEPRYLPNVLHDDSGNAHPKCYIAECRRQ
jgi:hypothetical protein